MYSNLKELLDDIYNYSCAAKDKNDCISFVNRIVREYHSGMDNPAMTKAILESSYSVDDERHSIEEWIEIFTYENNSNAEKQGYVDKLFDSIESYRRSDFFQNLLKFCAKFKLLAPYNAMLVRTQMPSARYVLNAYQWKKQYDRKPTRNARPLIILRVFGPVDYVFDISETEPIHNHGLFDEEELILKELEQPYKTDGEVKKEVYDKLVNALPYYGIKLDWFKVAPDYGARIKKEDCTVIVDGYTTKGYYVIDVNDKADKSTAFASICHELGHLLCHHLSAPASDKKEWWKLRSLKWVEEEFEAEIVSYIICERCRVGNKSWTYLARVLGRFNAIPKGISVEDVFKAANEIEKMISPKIEPKDGLLYKKDSKFKAGFDAYKKEQKDK